MKNIKVGTVLILCESTFDAFVEILKTLSIGLEYLISKMKVSDSAQTVIDITVKRKLSLREISTVPKFANSL